MHEGNALETVLECPFVQEQPGPVAKGAIAAKRAQFEIENGWRGGG